MGNAELYSQLLGPLTQGCLTLQGTNEIHHPAPGAFPSGSVAPGQTYESRSATRQAASLVGIQHGFGNIWKYSNSIGHDRFTIYPDFFVEGLLSIGDNRKVELPSSVRSKGSCFARRCAMPRGTQRDKLIVLSQPQAERLYLAHRVSRFDYFGESET
jgi:hypothetical protein